MSTLTQPLCSFFSFMMPHLYHYIQIYDKRTKKTTYEKHYNFPSEPKTAQPWSTYR